MARSLEVLIEDHQKVMALNQSAWAQTRQLEETNNALKHDLLKIVGESTVRKQVKNEDQGKAQVSLFIEFQ